MQGSGGGLREGGWVGCLGSPRGLFYFILLHIYFFKKGEGEVGGGERAAAGGAAGGRRGHYCVHTY